MTFFFIKNWFVKYDEKNDGKKIKGFLKKINVKYDQKFRFTLVKFSYN